MKNKKAVSVMIGYVLLVTLAVVMGGIVYQWMKTYVPPDTEEIECPEGVSIFIVNYTCEKYIGEENITVLNLYLKNNGRFNLGGYFIYATNTSNQTVATIDLSQGIQNAAKMNPGVKFNLDSNEGLPANDIKNQRFEFTNANFIQITSVEIIPIRWQEQNGKEKPVACTVSKINEQITCTEKEAQGENSAE